MRFLGGETDRSEPGESRVGANTKNCPEEVIVLTQRVQALFVRDRMGENSLEIIRVDRRVDCATIRVRVLR